MQTRPRSPLQGQDPGLATARPSSARRLWHLLRTQVFDSAAIATHSTLVHLTSYFFFLGGMAGVLAPLLPDWMPGADPRAYVGIGSVAVGTAVFAWCFGQRLPHWFFEVSVVLGTGLVTVLLAFSGSAAGAVSTAYVYLFIVVDSALFFSLRGMLRQYGLMLVASVTMLRRMDVPIGAVFILELCITAVMLAVAWVARATSVHERDQLTKLFNRRVFEDVLARALAANEARHEPLSLVVLALDRFQAVNETHGREGADELLRKIATTWTRRTPEAATLSRLAGDRFALLLHGADATTAARKADTFRDALPAGVTASAGVAVWQSGDSPSTLIGRAESAALDAKTYGRDTTMVFGDPARQATSIEMALQAREFVMVYQPIFRLPERTIVSYEALIRWQHPHRGQVSPAHFIPIAEKTGAIHALGRWTLDEVAAHNRGGRQISVAVNASMLELRLPGYADAVRGAVERHGIEPGQMTIEVTEAVFDGDTPGVLTTMNALKDIGVKIAIDDFGAGYSSLRWLDRFPADILKIDKSFVDTITAPDQELTVLSNIITLGRALGLTVLAEGVENETQAAVLQRLGVERIQGYLLGRPAPLDHGRLMSSNDAND